VTRVRNRTWVLLVVALVAVAVGVIVAVDRNWSESTAATDPGASSTSTTGSDAATTTVPTTTTTTVPLPKWPEPPGGGPGAVVTPTGIPLAVVQDNGDGTYVVRTPCGGNATVPGTRIGPVHVVLDAGHGGEEPGAVGPAGTLEKAVNLAIAQETKRQLEELGASVVLTRAGDYRITLLSRAEIVTGLRPLVFVSIHHNAEPDRLQGTPGSETFFQVASPESKRAAGLVYEELVRAFRDHQIQWAADTDAGAKYRPNMDGGDFYGILRRSAGVPAVLSEAAFITNPPEEMLLASPEFQKTEATALTKAIVRFATTADPGSGFVEPYARSQPAGGGGGPQGCEDPPLQ
jgi:N-acetylmuramoyl-L-alanine amidase